MTIVEELRQLETEFRFPPLEFIADRIAAIIGKIPKGFDEAFERFMKEEYVEPSSKVASAEDTSVPADLLIVDDNDGSPRYIEPKIVGTADDESLAFYRLAFKEHDKKIRVLEDCLASAASQRNDAEDEANKLREDNAALAARVKELEAQK